MEARARTVEGPGILSPVVSRPVPEPGPGELLLRIHATSVNYHDIIGVDGGIPDATLGRVPFSDNSATVEAVGSLVTDFKPGDVVIAAFFPRWLRGDVDERYKRPVLGDQIDGTLQTHLCVSPASVARAPGHLNHGQNATLGCAGLTAWRSLVVEGNIKPGDTILLQGTGGVSMFALGFAKMLGARVIITSSSGAKLEKARSLGADALINYRDTPDWDQEALKLTDGRGVDLVVEVGGGATIAKAVKAARVGGRISVIGVLAGYNSADFPLATVMQRNIAIKGITVGSVEQLDQMCRAIDQNKYEPLIDKSFYLSEAEDAIDYVRAGLHFGKVVVTID